MGNRNLLIVVSAPSGAGKTTLCDRLLQEVTGLAYSVSCTTRHPRGAEQDGVDYHFLDECEFRKRIAAGEFLEYATVHGNLYGTLRDSVASSLESGQSVLMDIDVQGAAQIRERLATSPVDDTLRKAFVDIFIEPPSLDALRQRLMGRGEDPDDEIERRLAKAASEMSRSGDYRYHVVNDSLERAYEKFKSYVLNEMIQT
ncbi:MAG: guanylate kinase [Kiritimatiellae bacterium]|nr:guanylate kinase [Kiritimatiellia bacterium]